MKILKKILFAIFIIILISLISNANQEVQAISVKIPSSTKVQTTKAPTVSNMKITNITSSGYTVTCNYTADAGVKEAYMPTWSEKNAQDDIVWHKATVKGNTLTCNIKISDHNNESGKYYTHIYLYDMQGRKAKIETTKTITVPSKKAPTVSNMKISNVTSTGYTVTCNFTAEAGLEAVYMPTWSARNGQDDIIWHKAIVNGNTATFNVKTTNHNNETGTYYTHIYVRDILGRQVMTASQGTIKVPEAKLQINSVEITNISTQGYTIKCNFTADSNVKKIQMPTWSTQNGQDDIIWYEPTIQGNTATLTIKTSNHNGDLGEYATHIYLYDKNNKSVIKEEIIKVSKWEWVGCYDVAQYCKDNSSYCKNLSLTQISNKAITFGKKYIGKSYTSDMNSRLGPNAFDCSGYVYYIYMNAFGNGNGVNLGTDTLWIKSTLNKYSKSLNSMKKGDLLLATNGYPDGDSRQERHIAIYLGNNQILHCGNSTGGVKISNINYFDNL